MIGCLRTRVRKQPIIALYFESETVLKFYNLEAWYVGTSKLFQVSRSCDLRIVDACCLPMSLWRDVINKMANFRDCTRQVFVSGFFVNFSFKWYALVKLLREQLKHVNGRVDKQVIQIYYIGYSRKSASK